MWFAYAIWAAFFFGLRGILYQWTSQRSIDRNLMFIGVYISSTILVGNLAFWRSFFIVLRTYHPNKLYCMVFLYYRF